jgi:hypothetical protein
MLILTEPSRESVFTRLKKLTGHRIRRSSEKYALACPGPLSDPDDFEQNVYLRLYEWLDDPVHLDQAEGLLEDSTEALKFMQQFARARICDHIDVNCATTRDQRQTLHSSQFIDGPSNKTDDPGATLMELLLHPHDRSRPEPFSQPQSLLLEDLKTGLPRLAAKLLDALVDPPQQVREAFVESRIRVSKGMATLAEPLGEHGECVLRLTSREDYLVEDTTISWPGPVERGEISTTAGPARITQREDMWPPRVTIRFASKLTVYLDRHSLEGEFIRESVRPSPSPFDIGVMADYLGTKMLTLRLAWNELRAALGVDFPGRVPDIP